MRTPAVAPNANDERFVRGVSPNSATALTASGTTLTFSPAQYEVQDGQRYGVEARIVRPADGILSTPVFGDFLKSV